MNTHEIPLTKEQLRERLNLKSIRSVEQLMTDQKIPYSRFGHRIVRFYWSKVAAALAKFEVKAVGQDVKGAE